MEKQTGLNFNIRSTPAQVAELPEWVREFYNEFLFRVDLAVRGLGPPVKSEDIARDMKLCPLSADAALAILSQAGILTITPAGEAPPHSEPELSPSRNNRNGISGRVRSAGRWLWHVATFRA